MSLSRSKVSKQSNLQFRKIQHNRSGHQLKDQHQLSLRRPSQPSKIALPTESRLESSLQLHSRQSRLNHPNSYQLNQPQRSLSRFNQQQKSSFSSNSRTEIRQERASRLEELRDEYKNYINLKTLQNPQDNQLQSPTNKNHLRKIQELKLDIPKSRLGSSFSQTINNKDMLSLSKPNNQDLVKKYQVIDEKLHALVTKKLKNIFNKIHKNTKKHQNKSFTRFQDSQSDQIISKQMQKLLKEIRSLQTQQLNNCENKNDLIASSNFLLLNKKISFVQKLIAQNLTEAELMKKYYFAINSCSRSKGSIGDFSHLNYKIMELFKERVKERRKMEPNKSEASSPHNVSVKKPLFKDTTNKCSFKTPKLDDYESYRYKQKNVAINIQPLPRSSYKRQFLYLKSEPNQQIINRGNSPFFPNAKTTKASSYANDYKTLKANPIDYKQLDAYHNKIKVLKISYMPKHRLEAIPTDTSHYVQDIIATQRPTQRAATQEMSSSKVHRSYLVSEARREFQGDLETEKSKIKNQQLKEFQYKLKSLYKC